MSHTRRFTSEDGERMARRIAELEQQLDELQAKCDELAEAANNYAQAVYAGNFVEIAAACFKLENLLAKHRGTV